MTRSGLTIYAWVLVAAIFVLVVMGGNVTSMEAGMAFEDWPTTAGHNMLLTPLDVWWQAQDKFAEHSHRLMGALVGLLTIGLVVWLWIACRRQRESKRPWRNIACLGTALLGLVIIQGLMGGFRVIENSRVLAFLHGILGQFVLGFAVVTASVSGHLSAGPNNSLSIDQNDSSRAGPPVRRVAWMMLGMFIIQLILGAGVRHAGAAVAIPDFPASYGRLIPPISQAGLDQALAERGASTAASSPGHYQLWQVWLHFAHRLGALGVLGVTGWAITRLFARLDWAEELTGPTILIVALLLVQIVLGIMTVLTRERPSVATLHQTIGAALLAAVTWLTVRVHFARRRLSYESQKVLSLSANDEPRP